jgi:phage-related tail fiber protein
MAAETIIQLRRGSAAAWSSQNPVLSAGEFGLETDTFKMKMGDGSTSWESLGYTVKQVDNLLLDANTISSVDTNGDIVLDPNGEGVINVSSARITNVAAPTGANDAANKAYVDATKQGLDVKNSVHVATTGNITLSGTQTVDGVSLVAEDRVLVKNQSTGSENGIYVVKAGSWERAADADSDADVTPGMFTFVEEGSVNADSGWVLTTDAPITLGTTALAFTQFSGAGQVTAGDGMTKTGNTLNVVGTSNRITVDADSVDIASTYVGQTSISTLGTVSTGTWQGTAIDNAYLANSDVSFGGVTVSLGSSDATPAFNLSDATAYPGDSSLVTVGTVATGTWNASVIDEVYGGTGLSSYTAGDIIYASATNTLSKLAKGTAKYFLKMDSAGDFPEWSNSLDGGTP